MLTTGNRLPNDSFNFTNDIVLKPQAPQAITQSSTTTTTTTTKLNCRVYNSNKLIRVEDMQSAKDSISFLVNTENAGVGELKCHGKYSNGSNAIVQQRKLDTFIYSIKIYSDPRQKDDLDLYLEHVPLKI